jgi:hypothetical protein
MQFYLGNLTYHGDHGFSHFVALSVCCGTHDPLAIEKLALHWLRSHIRVKPHVEGRATFKKLVVQLRLRLAHASACHPNNAFNDQKFVV